jgi:hypothetical protein
MSLKNPTGGSRPLTPIGNHIARLCQIIDLGTQPDEQYGPRRKVRFTFELTDESADFGKGQSEPFLISRVLGFVFSKKSNLKAIVEGMNGGPLRESEIEAFDQTLRGLLGQPCMVNVVHAKGRDTTFANIEAVAPVPAKLRKDVPPLQNRAIFFEVEMGPESEEFQALPDFLQSQIANCREWQEKEPRVIEDDDGQQELKFG